MGVHESHCCKDHGCKYGETDCPVETGLTKQLYPCEDCPVTFGARLNPPVMTITAHGVDHEKKHDFLNLTLEEVTEQMRKGHIPNSEDIKVLVSHLEEFQSLRKFTYAVRAAGQYLPRTGGY